MSYTSSEKSIIREISVALNSISIDQVNKLINEIKQADRVFFVGVGRVLLSLEAIAKRFSHLGIMTAVVGDTTEPAITSRDLLIVGSGSGESIFPLGVAKKAKEFHARIAHIGSNPSSSMKELTDCFVRIPVQSKLSLADEITSIQPMTSLFEQSLLLLGDSIALMMIDSEHLDMHKLWQHHANLE
ncbi:3-hexulose-6-phosphate isomerase [Coriobacterium glomerans PW2]|uniref:3-hexulose-6-phosphate isomerase n=1 Tax=Coriobacterium glomerans (strain ATCC 49209 / DSM 20642 / JCM 10262 / PW2) TaxID=700015 RepID=F2NBE6_CORGP|nr:6-phospho-3-hexuloisomerase [Coriobacterium glomerans]AEB06682.1 3-hexulose-6-phosphate isomerase [Coriobacterium glomerans PW2]